MRPSMAEPMVLQVGPLDGARIGDVIVFDANGVRIAHRIIAIDSGGFRTAGDAQPHVVEVVRTEQVVGRVVAVWSDASKAARRVDCGFNRVRSWYFAVFHRPRRFFRDAHDKIGNLLERAKPHVRPRTVARLVDALAAGERNDAGAFITALRCNANALETVDERHRCGAVLSEYARQFGVASKISPEIGTHLRRARLNAVLGAGRMQRAVHRTVDVLRAAEIEFALLKGAARMYGCVPGAAYHPSDDIDVFVRERDVDRAVEALRACGWMFHDTDDEVRRFRRRHHHAASLFSPSGDFPVEIHHALAQPGTLSTDTSWDALRAHLVPLEGSAGSVLQLDPFGTAAHLAVHAIGLTRLRDIALLAALLPVLTDAERDELQEFVQSERLDAVRLAAAVALAARVAGMRHTLNPKARAYLRWALRREDLPNRLRVRCGAIEAHFAQPHTPWPACAELVPWWSRGTQLVALPWRVLARSVCNALALIYAMRMATNGRREST